MGTPDFAVPALSALRKSGVEILSVVTRPDRPKGRGRKTVSPPVKIAAEKLGCEVWQPESIKTEAFRAWMTEKRPDLLVVVAYGQILPKRILELPLFGAVNVHASLLPRYRGPAPIQWAIINGEKKSGVTTMLMDAGLDTGEVLMAAGTKILATDTAGTLHDRLAVMGGELLKETIHGMQHESLRPAPQDHKKATYAPLLKKSDGHIDWREPAEVIERKIRGMNPWPLAYTFYEERRLNIFRASVRPGLENAAPGTVLSGFSGELRVAAGSGGLSILELQGASGKRLHIRDFLSGTAIPEGSVLK